MHPKLVLCSSKQKKQDWCTPKQKQMGCKNKLEKLEAETGTQSQLKILKANSYLQWCAN